MAVVSPILFSLSHSTAAASQWTKKLSVAVLKLRELGDLDYLRNKWWESSCLHKSRERWSPLQPQALGGLSLTLAIGLALGVIAAVVELSNKSRHAAGHAKVGDGYYLLSYFLGSLPFSVDKPGTSAPPHRAGFSP